MAHRQELLHLLAHVEHTDLAAQVQHDHNRHVGRFDLADVAKVYHRVHHSLVEYWLHLNQTVLPAGSGLGLPSREDAGWALVDSVVASVIAGSVAVVVAAEA